MNTISFRRPNSRIRLILLITCAAFGLAANATDLKLAQRWVYCPTNLLVDKNADEVIALINRAAKAGYNGMLLSDSKSSRLGEMDARYFRKVERAKKAAAAAKVQIVPAVFPIGYSEALLSHDPNLAEGLAVRDALFVVHNGEARCAADPLVSLRGGQF